MWFVYALLATFAWGIADLFYKKGAVEGERYSHLKTAVMVGLVMGIHAIVTLVFSYFEVSFTSVFPFVSFERTAFVYDFRNLLVYAPVSLMYALSMVIGYYGLRYLELSVSSPIQNASGAVSFLLLLVFGVIGAIREGAPSAWAALAEEIDLVTVLSVFSICVGVFLLGILEKKKQDAFVKEQDKKYKIGLIAFFMPILYCVIDSLGTVLDGLYLDDFAATPLLNVTEESLETVANTSYELTFFLIAVVLLIYMCAIKKESFKVLKQRDRALAAIFETAGQLVYVYAMAGNGVIAAPIIASYCVVSILLSRIFLKEKLSLKQYGAVLLVLLGIVALGILEGLAEA